MISVNDFSCQIDNLKTTGTVTCGGDIPITTITFEELSFVRKSSFLSSSLCLII